MKIGFIGLGVMGTPMAGRGALDVGAVLCAIADRTERLKVVRRFGRD
jgi:3-hydroxyisobutyrate dehydrogenase-like beta-hydroxyacid dehydrogenase